MRLPSTKDDNVCSVVEEVDHGALPLVTKLYERDGRATGPPQRVPGRGATVLGVSADSVFSQGVFREEHGFEFDLVSGMAGEVIDTYDLEMDIEDLGLYSIANRATFVLNEDGTITHSWVADDPTNEPDYDELVDAVKSV